MEKLFTKESISIIIAILGFILSVINAWYLYYTNRRRFVVKITDLLPSQIDGDTSIDFGLLIENKSRITLTISQLYLVIGNQEYSFDWEPTFVACTTTKLSGVPQAKIDLFSMQLPQTIQGLGAVGGFFHVKPPYKFLESDLKNANAQIKVYTTRGIKAYPIFPI